MPSRAEMDAAIPSIQEQLTQAAQVFAQEVLRILSGSTLSDLTSLTGQALQTAVDEVLVKRGPGRPPKSASAAPPVIPVAPVAAPVETEEDKKDVPPRTSAMRKLAGTKPVQCPVGGCKTPGVRSKMNFCHDHFGSFSKPERLKMRQAQKAHHVPDALEFSERAGRPLLKRTPQGK